MFIQKRLEKQFGNSLNLLESEIEKGEYARYFSISIFVFYNFFLSVS